MEPRDKINFLIILLQSFLLTSLFFLELRDLKSETTSEIKTIKALKGLMNKSRYTLKS